MFNITRPLTVLAIASLMASPAVGQARCDSPSSNSVASGFADRASAAAQAWSSGRPMAVAAARPTQPVAAPIAPPPAAAPAQGPSMAETMTTLNTLLQVGAGIAAIRSGQQTQPTTAARPASSGQVSCGGYMGGTRWVC
ncbi:MAG: hypothetical protein II336_17515 [Loktanella sp.]|nr:hypothetical protein [Loktanella sp.]